MKTFNHWIIVAIIAIAACAYNVNARFGQQNVGDPLFREIAATEVGFVGNYLGDLSGAAVRALLAKAPPCAMQEVADHLIDVAIHIGGSKKKKLIKLAKKIMVLEKNTPENGLKSKVCDLKPRNPELNGLVPKQDPTKGSGTGKPPFTLPEIELLSPSIPAFYNGAGKLIAPGKSRQGVSKKKK